MFLFGKETGGSWYETGISGRWWKKEGPIGRWNRFAVPSDAGTGLRSHRTLEPVCGPIGRWNRFVFVVGPGGCLFLEKVQGI